MEPPVTIRGAVAEDARPIAAVHVQAWREAYAGLLPDEMLAGLSVDSRAAAWARSLAAPAGAMTLVAEVGGKVVGFGDAGAQRDADLRARGFDGEIRALYVLADSQRRGLGRRLVRDLALGLIAQAARRPRCGCCARTGGPEPSTRPLAARNAAPARSFAPRPRWTKWLTAGETSNPSVRRG